VPEIDPLEAWELLAEQSSNTVLVDVRTPEKYNKMHVSGAENWPYEEISELKSTDTIPERFQDKELLLICNGGVDSARATQELRGKFQLDAVNVIGGMQAWIASSDKNDSTFISASGEEISAPYKDSPMYEELALTGAVLIIKPLYTLIALLLIVLLWRVKAKDGVALRWGLIFFFIGENACATNIIFFNHSSYLLEFLHMYGMAIGFAFAIYALLEALDSRILNYSDPGKKCALLGLCKQCIKYTNTYCRLGRLLYFMVPVLFILAFIPLLANFNVLSYNTSVMGMFHNYSHPVIIQLFELRYAPVYALIFLGISFFTLLLMKRNEAELFRVLFAIGTGFFAFSYLRLFFFGVYHENLVWPNFWEELTELMYVFGLGLILWTFRGIANKGVTGSQ